MEVYDVDYVFKKYISVHILSLPLVLSGVFRSGVKRNKTIISQRHDFSFFFSHAPHCTLCVCVCVSVFDLDEEVRGETVPS